MIWIVEIVCLLMFGGSLWWALAPCRVPEQPAEHQQSNRAALDLWPGIGVDQSGNPFL